MSTASDIITYIGIPLAVLGVLPIFYTFINSFFTARNIRILLRKNGFEARTGGSLMSGVVEVSLPRFSITLLERTDPQYWTLNSKSSNLKGASWTFFNWNYIITGTKLYRLQYSDDLHLPQAEMDFEELLSFLLDRGAVPDAKGLHMLRVSGLWTPTGTSLMLSPDSTQTVLRVTVCNESDGILSLAVQWKREWDKRDPTSLPPSWMRLENPQSVTPVLGLNGEVPVFSSQVKEKPIEEETSGDFSKLDTPTSLRFRLDFVSSILSISTASWEHDRSPLPSSPSLKHLHLPPASIWFPSIVLALGLSRSLPLYTHTISPSLHTLCNRDSIPCGVLVILDLLAEADVADWETKYDRNEDVRGVHERMMKQQWSLAAESMMGPEQARVAKMAREAEERARFGTNSMAQMARKKEREAKREREAVGSGRLETEVVAGAGQRWLKGQRMVKESDGVQNVVEGLLIRMVQTEELAMSVCRILERWREWSERGGMNGEDLALLRENKVAFCYASCVMGLLKDVCAKDQSTVAVDIQECIRVWNKIRLG